MKRFSLVAVLLSGVAFASAADQTTIIGDRPGRYAPATLENAQSELRQLSNGRTPDLAASNARLHQMTGVRGESDPSNAIRTASLTAGSTSATSAPAFTYYRWPSTLKIDIYDQYALTEADIKTVRNVLVAFPEEHLKRVGRMTISENTCFDSIIDLCSSVSRQNYMLFDANGNPIPGSGENNLTWRRGHTVQQHQAEIARSVGAGYFQFGLDEAERIEWQKIFDPELKNDYAARGFFAHTYSEFLQDTKASFLKALQQGPDYVAAWVTIAAMFTDKRTGYTDTFKADANGVFTKALVKYERNDKVFSIAGESFQIGSNGQLVAWNTVIQGVPTPHYFYKTITISNTMIRRAPRTDGILEMTSEIIQNPKP